MSLRWLIAGAGLLAALAGSGFAGWWLHGNSAIPPARLLDLGGGRGFTTLMSPGSTNGTAVHEPTGREVPFLRNNDMNALDPSGRFLFTSHETNEEAGVTRIDLEGDDVAIVATSADFTRFDGLLWTPWNTLLVAEETNGGRLFEILNPLAEPAKVEIVERPAFGRRKHEGLGIDERGNIYGVDEGKDGLIVRFQPDAPLTAGRIELLALNGNGDSLEERRVSAAWVPADDGDPTTFDTPEDVEVVSSTLYVAISGEDRVVSVDLTDADNPTIGIYIDEDVNADGLDSPDNLANDPSGNLYVSEDLGVRDLLGGARNEIWFARTTDDPLAPAVSVERVATIRSGRDEPSGLLVDSTGERLYVNILGPNDSIFVVPIETGSP